MLFQMRSEPWSKALCLVSVLLVLRPSTQFCNVQLHAEGGSENGTEESSVTPDNGAAVGCQ